MADATLTQGERSTIARLRLASQLVAPAAAHTPAEVVRHMLAMQAQDLPAARWAVGSRAPGATASDIDAALDEGSIVRSWPMRGTLHLTAPEDLGWMLSLTAERVVKTSATTFEQEQLTAAVLGRAESIVREALAGGRSLGREQLRELFTAGGIAVEGQRCYHLLWYLAQTRVLCLGPLGSHGQDFVLFDEWVTLSRILERDESLGELAHRYFSSHGPATVRDLAWWASLTLTDARRGLEIARPRLARLEFADTEHYLDPAVLNGPAAPWTSQLLAGFDEYLLGYQNRSAVLDAQNMQRIVPGNNGVFKAMLVHRGEIRGTWTRTVAPRKGSVDVAITSFGPLPASAWSAVRRRAKDYARHLGHSSSGTTESVIAAAADGAEAERADS